ncbi:MAG: undecaprenyldiphospho-muramoylpentapeptide beta-N-acetylglucosaminyltransferase [Ignavibacteriales bacterium]|nr:undecaprenyldiphospho-muramoylpentapeptide beta-N-acetylglucosaminyltransferase [Ignavibacteriales bacterium]
MSNERLKILIAAGGTGGHVFPAIAIADEIKKLRTHAEIIFIGTKEKIESRVVPQRGYPLEFIWISGFHRSVRMDNFLFPIKVVVSLVQSFFLMKRFQPDIVIGTGGYVCGPVLYAASLLGIPTVVHESNSYPGITTRMLSTRATRIFTAFDATARWLKRKDNIELAGTPTRDVLGTVSREDGIRFFNLDPLKKTMFVFGGSLGATSINQAVKLLVNDVADFNIQLIWQTGSTDATLAKEMAARKNCWVNTFIDKMEYAYAAADVVVCRAGATTLAELTRLGKASVLIPYPHAAADHQTFNAQTLVDAGAAVMIADRDVKMKLKDVLNSIMNDDKKRLQMNEASRAIGKPNAGREIAQRILELAK